MTGCGNFVMPTKERVTFALVIYDEFAVYDGMKIYADVRTDAPPNGEHIEEINGIFKKYENTTHDYWAQMTTLDKIWTNQRYYLWFWIDMNDNALKDSGDKEGVQHFNVASGHTWTETKYFVENLDTVP
jgi:hypothetical protein